MKERSATDAGQRDEGRREQATLYGEPLGQLFRRLGVVLGLTQGQLASTIGVSASMLSQLMSARRVKIGNPAVVQRVYALAELADDVAAGRVVDGEIERRLTAVRDVSGAISRTSLQRTEPTESSGVGTVSAADAVAVVRGLLRAVASGRELQEVADLVAAGHPGIAEVLRVYGVGHPDAALEHYERHQHLL